MGKCQDEVTVEESKLINQLRERVENELPASILLMEKDDQDLFLLRWIRARDLHLDNATKMLRNSLEWRKENNADKAADIQLHPFFLKNFDYSCVGQDKDGHPLFVIPFSDWDFRKVLNEPERLDEFDDLITNYFETVCGTIRAANLRQKEKGLTPITQMVFILDVQNYPYGQLVSLGAIKKLLQFASTYEAHYPEIMYKGVFINCPFYFNMFLAIIRPVLAPRTMSKLVCYSNMAEWQRDMAEFVDPEIVPEKFGGMLKIEHSQLEKGL